MKLILLRIIKNNYLVISAFILFSLFIVLYINRASMDVPFLDGLMMLPIVDKYFNGTMTLNDFNIRFGEHRLIGYSLIYLLNAIFFELNIK